MVVALLFVLVIVLLPVRFYVVTIVLMVVLEVVLERAKTPAMVLAPEAVQNKRMRNY